MLKPVLIIWNSATRHQRKSFNEEDFGKWKFCNDADIRKIVGDNKTPLKIAVMADVGRTDFKKDIIAKKDSPIDSSELQHTSTQFLRLLK